jgi:inhibitor of KinA sporulation pathway (predicted exonuclease)
LKNLHPQVTIERTGTHHHALDDARYQAMHLMKLLNEPVQPRKAGE